MIFTHTLALNNTTDIIKLPKGFYHWVRIFEATNAASHCVAQIVDSVAKPTSISSHPNCVKLFQQKNGNAHDETPDSTVPCENPFLVAFCAGNLTINVIVSMSNSEIVGTNRKNNKR